MRLNLNEILATPPCPLGMIPKGDPGVRVPIEGMVPNGVAGEILVHQKIYSGRPDVKAICRIQPPSVMVLSALGAVPQPRHGFGAYLRVSFWDDPRLLRNSQLAQGAALQLGQGNAVILRGNGAIVAESSLERALTLSWYLEDAARLELAVRGLQDEPGERLLSEVETAQRAVWEGAIAERMWAHLTCGDEEA